jgi:hypothetical protein
MQEARQSFETMLKINRNLAPDYRRELAQLKNTETTETTEKKSRTGREN